MKRILTLHLKRKYWEAIRDGGKKFEYRLYTDYWRKRLIGVHYDEIHLLLGYPKRGDDSKTLKRMWRLVTKCQEQHELFGEEPVEVLAIDVSEPILT